MNKKIFFISVLVIIFDQVSKLVIENILNVGQSITIIKNFFSLTYINNYGAAFGIFKNSPIFLLFISIVALILIYSNSFNFKSNKKNDLAFGLITGGILGNIIDRLFLTYVRDFLSFKLFSWYAPVFNIADSAIFVGVILLIIAIIKGDDKHDRRKKQKNWCLY